MIRSPSRVQRGFVFVAAKCKRPELQRHLPAAHAFYFVYPCDGAHFLDQNRLFMS
jgi:hypothetical protein